MYTMILTKATRNQDIYKESRQTFHVLKNTNGSDKGCLMLDGKCYSHHIGNFVNFLLSANIPFTNHFNNIHKPVKKKRNTNEMQKDIVAVSKLNSCVSWSKPENITFNNINLN